VVISEDLNYSLVFRPRQQSSSSGIHQRPRTFQPPRRCTRNHPAPAASTYRIATATEAGTDPRWCRTRALLRRRPVDAREHGDKHMLHAHAVAHDW